MDALTLAATGASFEAESTVLEATVASKKNYFIFCGAKQFHRSFEIILSMVQGGGSVFNYCYIFVGKATC